MPVLATEAGGVPEALGCGEGGTRPGLLVPPGDPAALGGALRAWLEEPAARRLRLAARERARRCAGGRRPLADVLAGLLKARRASPVSPERRDDRGRPSGSAQSGSSCASRRMRRPARPSSPSGSGGTSPQPAASRSTISAAAAARWAAGLRRGCPAHSTGWCTTATRTCWGGRRRCAGSGCRRRRRHRRGEAIRHHRAGAGRLAGASLVTASALLDLLTADELGRMLDACAGLPMLLAVTVVVA